MLGRAPGSAETRLADDEAHRISRLEAWTSTNSATTPQNADVPPAPLEDARH